MRPPSSTVELCAEAETFGPVKGFLEHLEDLRWMLLRCLLAVVLGMMLCLTIADDITALLLAPLESLRADSTASAIPSLEQRGPGTAFMMAMKAGLYGGIAMSLPILLLVVGTYLTPALKRAERNVLLRVMIAGTGLFLIGATAAHQYVLPLILRASLQFSDWLGLSSTVWFIDDYAAMVLRMMIGLGLAAEMPVVLLALIRLRLVSVKYLRRGRPYAVIANLVIAAMLTPTDIGSCLLLTLPLHALFELSLLLGSLVE